MGFCTCLLLLNAVKSASDILEISLSISSSAGHSNLYEKDMIRAYGSFCGTMLEWVSQAMSPLSPMSRTATILDRDIISQRLESVNQ